MSVSAEILKRVLALDVSPAVMKEMLAIVVDCQQVRPVSSNAQRQADYRARKVAAKATETITPVTTNATDVVTSAEPSRNEIVTLDVTTVMLEPSPTRAFFMGEEVKIDTPYSEATLPHSPKGVKKSERAIIESILLEKLSPEVAAGVIAHRRNLRKPLTELAARGLVKAFDSTGSPDDAARMMVERGWQGFRADWYANEKSTNVSVMPLRREANAGKNRSIQSVIISLEERFCRSGPDDRTLPLLTADSHSENQSSNGLLSQG